MFNTKVTDVTVACELLKSQTIRGNQSKLARYLKINRGTLRKYMNDTTGELHHIRCYNGQYQLMTKVQDDPRGKKRLSI